MMQPVFDSASGQYIDPNTGHVYDPNTGMLYDPNYGTWYTPAPDPASAPEPVPSSEPTPAPKKKKKKPTSHSIPHPEPLDESTIQKALSRSDYSVKTSFNLFPFTESFRRGEHSPYVWGFGLGCGFQMALLILCFLLPLFLFFATSILGLSLGALISDSDPPPPKKSKPAKVYKKDTPPPITP